MKFGVVIFPGSNCDEDIIHVLTEVLDQKIERLWHKSDDLKGCDFIILPGGFSYGDYLRSGAIARFSPIMKSVIEHCNKGGYAFGICNGFQILCEAGLLPGTLLHNTDHKFVCKNTYVTPQNKSLITELIPERSALKIPIAHGEGRYFNHKEALKTLNKNGQVIFRYCDVEGNVTPASNPNGSEENIAGVCNANKNVFGMMPHPERASEALLGNMDGKILFESLLSLEQVH